MKGIVAALFLLMTVAACGTGAPGSSTGPGLPTSAAGSPGPGLPTPAAGSPGPGLPTPAAGSGARIRLVNVWSDGGPTAEGEDFGPAVTLRVRGGETLLTAAPGDVTDFVDVPTRQYVDAPEHLVVAHEATNWGGNEIGVGELAAGDRVTVIVHGEVAGGQRLMRVSPIWERGEPFYGAPFPVPPTGQAILGVYAGSLGMLHVPPTATSEAPERQASSVLIRTDGGACLTNAEDGKQNTVGIGGNGMTFLELPAGSTTLQVASSLTLGDAGPDDPRCFIPAEHFATVTVDVKDGGQFGLIAWGQLFHLRVHLVPMDTP